MENINDTTNNIKQHEIYRDFCDLSSIVPISEPISTYSYSDQVSLASSSPEERLTAGLQVLLDLVVDQDNKVNKVDKNLIDYYIAKVDQTISKQLDAILHHSDFQSLESTWKELNYLVSRTDFRSNIKIHIMDADKEDLRDDFAESTDILQSGFYKHIYDSEYDTPGGEPISVIISNYEFGSNSHETKLLEDISQVASSAHCPFISNVSHNFFNKETIEEFSKINDIRDYMDKAEFIQWNSFRSTEDSRYIGLVTPKFLLRMPYGDDNPTKTFVYKESVKSESHDKYLWGRASFAFAANLTQSFKDFGWTVNIRGPGGGGKVEGLTLHQYDVGRGVETKIPTEVIIPETRELDLAELGFIPLSYYKGSNYACFFSANSSQKPQEYNSDEATANARINSRLPYVFLASRLGHYLKVIQRENIGIAKDKSILEKELNRWLKGLVTEMPNPSYDLIAKRPLRDGYVVVGDIPENPGYYKVTLFAIPHFQVEGMDIKLSLVSKMPSESKS